VFANGGYRVTPYLITRVVDARGNVLSEVAPPSPDNARDRAIDPRNAWIMTSLLKDVVRYGTGARAMSLNRTDLAGKTGTTNENVDAWFCGFDAAMVAVSWIGYDQPKTLGNNETGAVAALPIWIMFMGKALKGVPDSTLPMPEGIVAVKVNVDSGLRDDTSAFTEFFYSEFPPRSRDDSLSPSGQPGKDIRDQLF
jgi:penicillin-binding protein 1A